MVLHYVCRHLHAPALDTTLDSAVDNTDLRLGINIVISSDKEKGLLMAMHEGFHNATPAVCQAPEEHRAQVQSSTVDSYFPHPQIVQRRQSGERQVLSRRLCNVLQK